MPNGLVSLNDNDIMPRRTPAKDAADLVRAVPGSKPVKMLREAKAKEAARKKGKK
jgi:hypothetical protein